MNESPQRRIGCCLQCQTSSKPLINGLSETAGVYKRVYKHGDRRTSPLSEPAAEEFSGPRDRLIGILNTQVMTFMLSTLHLHMGLHAIALQCSRARIGNVASNTESQARVRKRVLASIHHATPAQSARRYRLRVVQTYTAFLERIRWSTLQPSSVILEIVERPWLTRLQ